MDSGSDSESDTPSGSTDDESDSVRRGLVSHPDPRHRAKVVTIAGLETSLANTSVMPKGKRPKRPLPLGSRPSDSTIVDPTSPKVFGPNGGIVNSGIRREGNSIHHGPNQADLDKRSGRPNHIAPTLMGSSSEGLKRLS